MENLLPKTAACPSCASIAHLRGAIPDGNTFAGRTLATPLPGGGLFECPACYLNFRWPRPAPDVTTRLYQEGIASAEADHRPDWQIAIDLLGLLTPNRSILDVGCSTGGFLARLGPEWRRAGIEIDPEAAKVAQGRGIEIIAHDFTALSESPLKFDVIVSFDVVEHSGDPAVLLRGMLQVVAPGGHLLISTGNTSSRTWRLMGSRYWYCHIPEHISFINPQWCRKIAAQAGCEVTLIRPFSHQPPRLSARTKELCANLLYASVPGAARALRRIGFGTTVHTDDKPPGWLTATDHMLVVFRKP